MHDLSSLTVFGDRSPRTDRINDWICVENNAIALASVSARKGFENAVAARLAHLIDQKNTLDTEQFGMGYVDDKKIMAFWMGAQQWMVQAPYGATFAVATDFFAYLKAYFGDTASLSEQTDAWVCFTLKIGEQKPSQTATQGLFKPLALLCNIDSRKMKKGVATRRSIHHIGCFILCDIPEAIHIYGPRSSAQSLHQAIIEAMHAAKSMFADET